MKVLGLVSLEKLQEKLWVEHYDSRSRTKWASETRRLTEEEWADVQTAIRERHLICVPHNACWGFGIGVGFYEQPPHVYPGAEVKPVHVLSLTQSHLPLLTGGKEPRFNEGWEVFSPLTHSKENAALMVEYGFGKPGPKSDYEY